VLLGVAGQNVHVAVVKVFVLILKDQAVMPNVTMPVLPSHNQLKSQVMKQFLPQTGQNVNKAVDFGALAAVGFVLAELVRPAIRLRLPSVVNLSKPVPIL
jgi:hypothetical protein